MPDNTENFESIENRHEREISEEQQAQLDARAEEFARIVNGGEAPTTSAAERWQQFADDFEQGQEQDEGAMVAAFTEQVQEDGTVPDTEEGAQAAKDAVTEAMNNTNVNNVDNINNRTRATVTEQTADNLIENNNVRNSSENIISGVGSAETVIRDADQAESNINQAESAARGIAGKVAAGESSGITEGENVLNAAMVAGADANATVDKATAEVLNGSSSADLTTAEAEASIAKARDVVDALSTAAGQVQDAELSGKMHMAAESITSEVNEKAQQLDKVTSAAAEAEEDATDGAPSSIDSLLEDSETKSEEDAEQADAPETITADNINQVSQEQMVALAKERSKREAEAAADETLVGQQIGKAA